MTYPHDESQRQKQEADDSGARPQNTPRYPRADDPTATTEHSPGGSDRKDTGIADRDGATPPGASDGGDYGGTN